MLSISKLRLVKVSFIFISARIYGRANSISSFILYVVWYLIHSILKSLSIWWRLFCFNICKQVLSNTPRVVDFQLHYKHLVYPSAVIFRRKLYVRQRTVVLCPPVTYTKTFCILWITTKTFCNSLVTKNMNSI